MPRAYTKSGSVEKYEPSLFSTGTYAFATVGSRDANGNYSISPADGYKEDSNGSYILATYYGGVPYTAKFSVESTPDPEPEPNYYINIGTTVKEEWLSDDSIKKIFVITISYNVPSGASITVSGRLVYNVIDAATGASSQTKKNYSYTCSGSGNDETQVATDSSKKGKEFDPTSWNNTSTSTNTWNIVATWDL